MSYVLILWISTYAVATAEYADKGACEAALKQLAAHKIGGVCTSQYSQ